MKLIEMVKIKRGLKFSALRNERSTQMRLCGKVKSSFNFYPFNCIEFIEINVLSIHWFEVRVSLLLLSSSCVP